jgi:hypothetical protein
VKHRLEVLSHRGVSDLGSPGLRFGEVEIAAGDDPGAVGKGGVAANMGFADQTAADEGDP